MTTKTYSANTAFWIVVIVFIAAMTIFNYASNSYFQAKGAQRAMESLAVLEEKAVEAYDRLKATPGGVAIADKDLIRSGVIYMESAALDVDDANYAYALDDYARATSQFNFARATYERQKTELDTEIRHAKSRTEQQ